MVYKIGELEWNIFFRYSERPYSGLNKQYAKEGRMVRVTEVFVLDSSDVQVASGEAVCSPADRFCKKKGRKIALAKMFKEQGELFDALSETSKILPTQYHIAWMGNRQLRTSFWNNFYLAKFH